MEIDKRYVVGGLVILAIIITIAIILSKNEDKLNIGSGMGMAQNYHGIAKKHQLYGNQLKKYPGSSNVCGAFGDVSNCPKYTQPTLIGEDTAIYAIHNGTIHDPRLKSRMCSYDPELFCAEPAPRTEPLGTQTAHLGPGTGLQVAYGYNMRKALIEGGSPAVL